jgi:alpha-L-fucosidase 2
LNRTYDWDFPLPRTHTGMLQGNGIFGAMIWGADQLLRITLGRADFWDRRGGLTWSEQQSYTAIRSLLKQGDEQGLSAMFEESDRPAGKPRRPSVLPIGHFEIDLGRGRLKHGRLNIDTGEVDLEIAIGNRRQQILILLDMDRPLLVLRFPDGLKPKSVRPVPAWKFVGDYLSSISFEPPTQFARKKIFGWLQPRPVDPTLCVAARQDAGELRIAVVEADTRETALATASRMLKRSQKKGFALLQVKNRKWWTAYWRDVPRIDIPNKDLLFLYEYGMYKFAGLTSPEGVAATLQGPWIEEYQMPPWSSDYHFNINVQMCYWPAYHGNRMEHLRPLFDLLRTWLPKLRENALRFLGIDDGLMLPHAVDDRCVAMGGFWSGHVDHGCTAWVAEMMHRYYRFTGDRRFLAEEAYPFMVGAMRVYEKLLERKGDTFELPVGVSPEYRGSQIDAWGRNASFQLACIHRLCTNLIESAQVLGLEPRPIWREVREHLPQAALIGESGDEQIALWEGTPLEESHRHHSHLAALCPFDTLNYEDESWNPILARSLAHWIKTGPGLWSGWCVPWASMICGRSGMPEAAELWLEIWRRLYTNEGHGTLHDVDFAGFSLMGKQVSASRSTKKEIMQMDAGMACVAALQEMLLQVRGGVNYLFCGASSRWKQVGFEGMRTECGFLVSARRRNGRVGKVRVDSLVGGNFKLRNPWGSAAVLVRKGKKKTELDGEVLEVTAKKGESFVLAPGA